MNDIDMLYSGSVDIFLHIKDKVIKLKNKHNAGTSYLTQCFAKFMTSDHDNLERSPSIDTPQFIDLEYRISTIVEGEIVWSEWSTYLLEPLSITSKSYDYVMTTDQSGAPFQQYTAHLKSALASYNMHEQITSDMEGSHQFRFVLKSGKDDSFLSYYHPMAYLDTDVETLSKISPGTQATIVWNMSLKNV